MLVDVAHIGQVHEAVPDAGFLEDFEGLRLVEHRGELGRVVTVRNPEEKAVFVGDEPEDFEVACERYQFVIVVVHRSVQGVAGRVDVSAGLEEFGCVFAAVFPEYADGLVGLELVAPYRHIQGHKLFHPASDGVGVLF